MADFSEITINTTAKKIERMANMEINNETIDDTSDDNSLPTSKLVYDFVSNSASGVNGDFVSYSQSQDLTDEQKETARNNIGAVDASLVVSRVSGKNDIPNGAALLDFFVSEQFFSNEQKQTARENIGAMVNKEWKIIATGKVEEDGVTRINITKDNDGNPFEIYDALVVYTDAPIATGTANIFLFVNNQPSNLAFQALHKSAAKFARITANWDGGNWAGISLVAGNSYSWAESVGGMTQYNAKRSPATSISLSTESTTPFPIGTKFELRGVVKV